MAKLTALFVAFATWSDSAGHAGATVSAKLTFDLDHSMWAAQVPAKVAPFLGIDFTGKVPRQGDCEERRLDEPQ